MEPETLALTLPIRRLVEFLLRTGSIDSRFTGFDRALEGARLHRKLQRAAVKEFPDYQAEVSLRQQRSCAGVCYTLEGRADGIFTDTDGTTTIDEIKTTTLPPELITGEQSPEHWAQAQIYAAIYAAQQQRITLSAAVRAALDYCREAYRAVGVITNGSVGPQQGKLRSLGLDRWAEAKLVFISDACGVMKPAPEIFRLAQTAAGGGPCVFVGDSCSQDIAGASACGWQTIWLSRTGESPTVSPTLTARSEQDLLPCLQALAE